MENSNIHARIGEKDVPVIRFKLRAWLHLEDLRTDISDAAKNRDRDKFVLSVCSYVSAASSIPVEEITQCYWVDVVTAFVLFRDANVPKSTIPLIKPRETKRRELQKEGWDYPHRSFYLWSNLLAKTYGWTLEYIAELDVDDALALIEEIFVDEQLDKEWQWALSENAYSYDSNTKKSKFVPLSRPEWMTPIVEIPKVRIKKSELPAGLILRWEDGKHSQPQ